MKRVFIRGLSLILMVLLCTSCWVTRELWDETDPNERIWIPSTEITEQELEERGIDYIKYEGEEFEGYLVEKRSMRKLRDYTLRTLGTPVTLMVDAVTAVTVVGVIGLAAFHSKPADDWAVIDEARPTPHRFDRR